MYGIIEMYYQHKPWWKTTNSWVHRLTSEEVCITYLQEHGIIPLHVPHEHIDIR